MFDFLYYVRQTQHPPAYHSLYLSIFIFFSHENPSQIAHLLVEPVVFKFCIHPHNGEIHCVRKNQDAEIYFFCPSLSCNTKGKISLQNWFNIPLMAVAGGM